MKNQLLAILALLFISEKASALEPADFSITRISAPYFIVDGNQPTTITRSYVGFKVTNVSSTRYTDLVFSINSIGTSVAGANYNILAPVSGVKNIGTLAPGESKVCYYYISYPANVSAVATFNLELRDLSPQNKIQSINIRNRSSISANAGGASTNSVNNQDLIGGIITDTVTYTVGNVKNGDENDFQVATSGAFDPTKLDLIQTKVIQSTVPGIPAGTVDSLYFISGTGSNGATVKVVWIFRIVAFNFTTNLLPLSGATSGSTNYKYTLNTSLGAGTPVTVSSNANPLTISKSSDAEVYCASNNSSATFTITINNPALFDVTIDKITDTLPAGFIFESISSASNVTDENSVFIPLAGAEGAIRFEGGVNNGNNTSYTVPAGGSLSLIYTALVPAVPADNITSGVRAFVGETAIGYALDTISVSCLLPVRLTAFTASRQNSLVLLRWTTEAEENTDLFIVQHSSDGANWTDAGTVRATGNGQGTRNYSLLHRDPVNGANYYRLKEVELTGRSSYSHIIRFNFENNGPSIRVFPNPVSNGILNLNSESAVNIMLLDNKGGRVMSRNLMPGNNRIDVSQLPKGLYIIMAGKESVKIIID